MSTSEAAREWRVSDRHVRNMCARGQVESMKLGALWRVWMEREPRRTDATAPEKEDTRKDTP